MRSLLSKWLFLAAFACLQAQTPQTGLELGVPVNGRLTPGMSLTFAIQVLAGQFVQIDLDPEDIGLTFVVLAPDGGETLRANGLDGSYGTWRLAFFTRTTGDYHVRVEPFEDATGPFTILLQTQRVPIPGDDLRLAAQDSLLAAIRHRTQDGPDALRSAVGELDLARQNWHSLSDAKGEALALSWLGRIQIIQAEPLKAIKMLDLAIGLWQNARERRAEGQAISFEAEAQAATGSTERALELYEHALTIRHEASDRRGAAETVNGMAIIYLGRGDTGKAIDLWQQTLITRESLGDRTGQTKSLMNLGTAYSVDGQIRAGAELLERALSMVHSPRVEGQILVNLGRSYGLLAEYQKALDYSVRALTAIRVGGDRRTEAILLNNFGYFYQALGEYNRAENYFNQSLRVKRELGDHRGEATTLSNIGFLMAVRGQSRPAMEKLQTVLPLVRSAGDRIGEGNVLNNLGDVSFGLKEFDAALEYYRLGLAVRTGFGDPWGETYSWNSFGKAFLALRRYDEALDSYRHALALARKIGDKNSELGAIEGMMRLNVSRNQWEEAEKWIEPVLRIVESSRAEIVLPDLRTSYFALRQNYYELAIEILMKLDERSPHQGYAMRALEVHERGQARTLVDLLRESGADVRGGVPAELLAGERKTRELLNNKIERRIRLQSNSGDTKALTAVNLEIDRLSRDYEQVETQLRSASPEYAALTQPVPLTAAQIQSQIGGDDTALVEYATGSERSYMWVVTRSSIQHFTLPPGRLIEGVARSLYTAISVRKSTAPALASDALAQKLGSMLLGPAAAAIRGKRLVFVPSGILCYIPFDVLGDPVSGKGKYVPLVLGHVISTLPSASVLPLLRNANPGRKIPTRLLAVLGDPVFEKSDPRVGTSGGPGGQPRTQAVVQRSVVDLPQESDERGVQLAHFSLGRLVFSRQEVESIYSLFPADQTRKFLDFGSSLASVTSPDLGQYRIIHLATHGLLDSEHPDRSALALSLVDRSGNPQPGLLKMADVFNLNLPAELVVLSACETALGSEIRGEGLVGLTRAFMYAGARRIVASSWKVDDLATAELMTSFYKNLAQGQSTPVALREAKLTTMKKPAWSSPYYWAAFTLQGEFDNKPIIRALQ